MSGKSLASGGKLAKRSCMAIGMIIAALFLLAGIIVFTYLQKGTM